MHSGGHFTLLLSRYRWLGLPQRLLTLVMGRRRGSSASSPNQAASSGHRCFQRNLQPDMSLCSRCLAAEGLKAQARHDLFQLGTAS